MNPATFSPTATKQADESREIVLTRVFDAPRALIFDAWTKIEHLEEWYGPKGFTITTRSADIRVGGEWRFVMHGPDGTDYDNRIRYREIVRPERIVYACDADKDDDPHGFEGSVSFEDVHGKTRVTMRLVFRTAEQRAIAVSYGAVELGKTTLEKLGEKVRALEEAALPPGELRLERSFAAPRALVFAAFTEPARFVQWFGPRGVTLPTCELDARPGGKLHFRHQLPSGEGLWVSGVYREVVAPEKLVFETWFSDERGEPATPSLLPDLPLDGRMLTSIELTERAGRTTVKVHQVSTSGAGVTEAMRKERRLAREGWSETLDRLGELTEAT